MESKGLKVNTGKTEVMVSGRNGTKVTIKDKEGKELNQVDQFKYLGVTFSEGGSETAIRAREKAVWQKWRELGPVIADKKIPTKLKTRLYTSGETCHLVWSRMLDGRSERGKYSKEDRNENAEKNQGGDSERQNEE